jgi:uncharacterized protein YbjQ (UPF0145 family)
MDGHALPKSVVRLHFPATDAGFRDSNQGQGENHPMAKKANTAKKVYNEEFVEDPVSTPRGLGPESAGQSGDLQGLSDVPGADSESVEELIEEGQALEADAVAGVEDAPDADTREVHVHERPEDDVPEEYKDQD